MLAHICSITGLSTGDVPATQQPISIPIRPYSPEPTQPYFPLSQFDPTNLSHSMISSNTFTLSGFRSVSNELSFQPSKFRLLVYKKKLRSCDSESNQFSTNPQRHLLTIF
jgi:hypothetical protein